MQQKKIDKIGKLEAKIIIKSTKSKLNATENKLKQMTRRRFKNWNSKEKNEAKPVSFKRKNKEIAKRKII